MPKILKRVGKIKKKKTMGLLENLKKKRDQMKEQIEQTKKSIRSVKSSLKVSSEKMTSRPSEYYEEMGNDEDSTTSELQYPQTIPSDKEYEEEMISSSYSDQFKYDEKLEKFINLALEDGEITDKERDILFKKAEASGVDLDEFEMVLDNRLNARKRSISNTVSQSKKIVTCVFNLFWENYKNLRNNISKKHEIWDG